MRKAIILLLALFLAVGAVFAAFRLIGPVLRTPPAPPAAADPEPTPPPVAEPEVKQRVIVFARARQTGDVIDAAADLTVAMLPVDEVPPGALTSMDIGSDAAARDRADRRRLRTDAAAGDPVRMSMFEPNPVPNQEEPKGDPADIDFLASLEADPNVIFFAKRDLLGLHEPADATVDIYIESDAHAVSGSGWVARKLIVARAVLRVASVNVTGAGDRTLYYVKLSDAAAERVRAARTLAQARLVIRPHGAGFVPPLGRICSGQVCFEALPSAPASAPQDVGPGPVSG